MEETFDQSLVLQNLLLNLIHTYIPMYLLNLFSQAFFGAYNHRCISSVICWQLIFKKEKKHIPPDARSSYTAQFTHFFHLTPEVAIWLNSFVSFILHDLGGGVNYLFHFTWHRWWCHLFHSFYITSVVVSFVSFVLYDISGGVICFIHRWWW